MGLGLGCPAAERVRQWKGLCHTTCVWLVNNSLAKLSGGTVSIGREDCMNHMKDAIKLLKDKT